jgi:SNF2 family DNA or RNA helicase
VKIGLTGTPIENQLRELKALFDLVMPGYMPLDHDFREFFVRPIERGENPKRRELLSRYVRPFVLRRRKVDVLPELPEKTEELYTAELIGEQKSLYRSVASQQAMPLIQQLKDESSPIPYMHIFAVLSSLKQICNHPAAYLKDVENYERYESGKWEAFVELIEEAMESEQKVVVFSQFLAMLDIIEIYLKKSGIGYAQIRGQTKNRGEEVARFAREPACKVFLGSLQAAGLGIDLTPASIVIHYDRWWNAARENQATDRVHRIGQVRGVQVFKLFTKGTIEEKIDRMIAKKAGLLEEVVSFDDHQIVKRLSRQEIIFLLEALPED